MFKEMLTMPVGEDSVDGTEKCPIYIPDVEVPEFDLFVSQAYGRWVQQ